MPYRPTQNTERQRLKDRARILEAARVLISKGGFQSAQVAAIAKAANLATGTVYRHFPSKADLFSEVFRAVAQHEVDMTAKAAQGESVREKLAAAVKTFAQRALRNRRLAFALLAEPVAPEIEAERLVFRRAYRDIFARVLEEGIATGELPRQNVELISAAVVGAIGEALVGPLSPAMGARAARLEKLLPDLVSFCLRAVTEKENRRVRSHRQAA